MSGKGEWVNLRFPNAFAHPFSFQGRDGGTRERMLVTIPKGVVLGDGRDVGGWNLSVRATPWALAQKRAGRPVSIGLRVGRTVELFKGVYGQINVYGVTTKSERHKRSYWTRTADGNGIGGRKAPVPYGS